MKRRFAKYGLMAAVLCQPVFVCCDGDTPTDYYNYVAPSYIDTVLIGDDTVLGEVVSVVHVYPYGCNSFERLVCKADADTISLRAMYRFKYEGQPCAHGSGVDTTQHVLCFVGAGAYTVTYDKNDSTVVHLAVLVK